MNIAEKKQAVEKRFAELQNELIRLQGEHKILSELEAEDKKDIVEEAETIIEESK